MALTSVFGGGGARGDTTATRPVVVGVAGLCCDFVGGNFGFDAVGVERWVGAFDVAGVLFTREATSDDDEDELALSVDDGLIERLRAANDAARACCKPGAVGRGM